MTAVWAVSLVVASAGADRSPMAMEVQVGLRCPTAEQIARAFDSCEWPTPRGAGVLVVARQKDGSLQVEWKDGSGEVRASRRLAPRKVTCAAQARTIALLAEAWSKALPSGSVPEATVRLPGERGGGARPAEAAPDAPPPPMAVTGPSPAIHATATVSQLPGSSATPSAPRRSVVPPVSASITEPGVQERTKTERPPPFGPLRVRLGASGSLDFLSIAPTLSPAGGGRLVVEVGLPRHFGLGLSGEVLAGDEVKVQFPPGSVTFRRQQFELFALYDFARTESQWATIAAGFDLDHVLNDSSGYGPGVQFEYWVPGGAAHLLYSHLIRGPVFAYGDLGARLRPEQAYDVNVDTPFQDVLFTKFPLGLSLELGLGVRFFEGSNHSGH